MFSRSSSSGPPALFPTFLLPSLPFRRRKSSSSSSTFSSPPISPLTPDAPADPFLSGHISYLRCGRCAVDLCLTSAIVSRGFTGRWGRAYLVSAAEGAVGYPATGEAAAAPGALPNTHTHKAVPRQLVTGAHTVSDVSCAFCGNVLGWKYVAADEESQQYKVGKFILETKRVSVATDWEVDGSGKEGVAVKDDDVEFDSQDEDECEDLFAGTWTAESARRRRRERRWGRD